MARTISLLALGLTAAGAARAQVQMAPTPENCRAATILAQGIALNIADQLMEQQAVGQVQKALASGNRQAFATARDSLLVFVQNGIAIRQANQQIAPRNNAAIPGLDVVANAQLTELGLALNLTGNMATDMPILAELSKDFAGGIMQNQKNMAAATQGCATAPTPNAPGAAPAAPLMSNSPLPSPSAGGASANGTTPAGGAGAGKRPSTPGPVPVAGGGAPASNSTRPAKKKTNPNAAAAAAAKDGNDNGNKNDNGKKNNNNGLDGLLDELLATAVPAGVPIA